jgi:Rod binding domain-containing protein
MATELSPVAAAVASATTAMRPLNEPTTMRSLGPSASGATAPAKPAYTPEQKAALKNLHATAQQFESLFVNMLFKSMRAAVPQTSISGEKLSSAETTFTEMLDEKRSESMAETGAFGIGKILEDQLKASVLANPAQAAKARLAAPGIL